MMKGILLSLMAILLVSGMMGAAYAWPDGIKKQNNFSDDKVDLKLKDQDQYEDWWDGVSETWVVPNMAPGDEFAFDDVPVPFVGLWGDFPGKVEISCNYTVVEESPQTEADTDWETDLHPDEMAKYMVITRCIYKAANDGWEIDCLMGELTITSGDDSSTNEEWQIEDFDEDGEVTFYEFKKSPLTNLPSPRKGGDDGTRFEMSVKFHEDAGNDFQGDIFKLTMSFTLKPGQAQGKPH